MTTIYLVAASSVLLVGLSGLAYYLYFCLNRPEEGFLFTAAKSISALEWVWIVLMASTWFGIVYSGVYTIADFFPVDKEQAYMVAGLVAALSLGVFVGLDRAAARVLTLQRTIKSQNERLSEIESLITAPVSLPTQETKISSNSADSTISRLSTLLRKRDIELFRLVQNDASKDPTADTKRKAEEKLEKQRSEKARLVVSYTSILESFPTNWPIWREPRLPDAERWYLVDDDLVERSFSHLSDVTAIAMSSESLAKRSSKIRELLLRKFNLRFLEGCELDIHSLGNERDGYLEFVLHLGADQRSLLEGIESPVDLAGTVGLLLLVLEMPRHLSWGHGMYDHDRRLLRNKQELIHTLYNDKVDLKKSDLESLDFPVGIRVYRSALGVITIACLGYEPGKGLSDLRIVMSADQIPEVQNIKIYHWGGGVFY